MIKAIIFFILGVLLGSLNFAIIYSKLRGDDIRTHGSKNAGATNVLRTYGKIPALIVFLLDLSKGVAAVLIARAFNSSELVLCSAALGAILGHNFPVYYSFKGGKGVATSFAVLLALHYEVALCALAVFVVCVLISRIVSLSSMVSAVSACVFALYFYGFSTFFVFCVIIAVLLIVRHRTNIVRLLNGTENKLGSKKK